MATITTLHRTATGEQSAHGVQVRSAASARGSGRVSVKDPEAVARKGSRIAAGVVDVPSAPYSLTSDLSSWPDVELLAAFQKGNDRAFAELYGRHKAEIYTYCLRMMGGDADLANDVFQEVFIKVYEKAAQFREGTNVSGWLYMIARRMCLNVFRTKRPCETIDLHPTLASDDRSLAPEYDEEQHFLREKLEQALTALPVEFREPFMLREFDGFSYGEIAEMTGTTLAMTKVRIYRAKQRMRELLAPFVSE
jgi:RNA polymerase sigma-70 factor (ECF subfamily)